MLKIPFLRNIFLIALVIALIFPLYNQLVLSVAYREILVEETEDEAARYATYLMHSLKLTELDLERDAVPEAIGQEVGTLMKDAHLIKIKLFAPSGRTVYSNNSSDLGVLNESPFLHDQVARGMLYSKAVNKEHLTSDGLQLDTDLVETYVPIMNGQRYMGAIEIYYDITESKARLDQLHQQSQWMLGSISAALVLLTLMGLVRASLAIRRKIAAEQALRKINEELEERVRQRTLEVAQSLEVSETIRKRMKAILTAVPDGLLATDELGQIILVNQKAETLLKNSPEACLGLALPHCIKDAALAKRLNEALKTGELGAAFDWTLSLEDGAHPLIFQIRISDFMEKKNDNPGRIILIQDVTREREVERMKSEFLAMATHELNTPLTAIMGYTELLSNKQSYGLSSEQEEEFNQLVMEKTDHLSRIVSDLTDASRYEAGHLLVLDRQRFSPETLLAPLVESYRERYPRRRWNYLCETAGIELQADRERFEQAVDYLFSNALKYSRDETEITLCQRVSQRGFELIVSDQGVGLDSSEINNIFEAFYRGNASDSAIGGTGLGLTTVRVIVEAHGGEVRAESQKGKGTHIHLLFPLEKPNSRGEQYDAPPAPRAKYS